MGITYSDGEDTWPEIQEYSGNEYVDINIPGSWGSGSIGPVRFNTAIRRQNRQGPGFRLPATAAEAYVARMTAAGVNGRTVPRGATMTLRQMYGRRAGPLYRATQLAGIVSESLRTPLLTFYPEDY